MDYVLKVIKIIKKHKREVLTSTVAVLFIIFLFALKYSIIKRDSSDEVVLVESSIEVEENEEEVVAENDLYYVDVKGAVVSPGVYAIEAGKRVEDVISLAGGLSDEADTTLLNLAKAVYDEMVIIVYTKQQVIDSSADDTLYTSVNDAVYIEENVSSSTGIININSASKDELTTLSGIGESKALAIISYREENGNFSSIEEVMNVSGIGQAIFDKIKDYITV